MAKAKFKAPSSDAFVRQYLETALWSSNDASDESGGEPFDKNYSIEDISDKSLAKAISDCNKFREENSEDLAAAGDDEQNAHDFWLTRNHHGAGFWDRGYEKALGDRLTKAAQAFGEVNPILGDDGKIYLE